MSTASRKDGALKVGKTTQKISARAYLSGTKNLRLKSKVCSLTVKLKDVSLAKHLGVSLDLWHFDLPKSTSE